MTSVSHEKWLPNEAQYQLLRAALLSGDEAIHAWQQWQTMVDLQDIDSASFGVLPKLYCNLNKLGIEHSELNRLKGIYRLTWTKNQTNFYQLTQILKYLYKAGIQDVLLLKGAALTLFHYKDFGLRPMGDIDILIP